MVVDLRKVKKELKRLKEKSRKGKSKILLKKLKVNKILKKSKSSLTIKKYEPTSILSDPNRFFKEEMEETKNAIFFR